MTTQSRILIVDDEEAILETMTFTFQDDYEVHSSTDPRRALEILDEKAPIAVVMTDQRMPSMTGVEFLARVYQRHPTTIRIILTGFSDMEAIVKAINDGHVYAYITKPWEPEQLKQVVKRAVEHHQLAVENARLLADLRRTNVFLEAVMDRLGTGALAVDAAGVVQAANQPALDYLGLRQDPRRRALKEVLSAQGLEAAAAAVSRLAEGAEGRFEEVEVRHDGRALRLRLAVHMLSDPSADALGVVVLLSEISHEPLRRRFDEIVAEIMGHDGPLHDRLEGWIADLRLLDERVRGSAIDSPGMAELDERTSRTVTALENWLAVDDALASEDYPDAQLLLSRMRLAMTRWPCPDEVPQRVRELARRVEAYYESGEHPKQHVL